MREIQTFKGLTHLAGEFQDQRCRARREVLRKPENDCFVFGIGGYLGGESFSIRSADKPLYHAAAVMVSGNVTALFDVALEMLVQCGLTRNTARSVLLPLIASTVHNLETKDPAQALTGTFSRGDVETVKRHLAALKKGELADALELYRLLGKRSLKLTKKHPQITQILKSV